jgi:hypothetical protein
LSVAQRLRDPDDDAFASLLGYLRVTDQGDGPRPMGVRPWAAALACHRSLLRTEPEHRPAAKASKKVPSSLSQDPAPTATTPETPQLGEILQSPLTDSNRRPLPYHAW